MKIIFCIDSLNKGGAERVLANLVNDFCQNNDILIITTSSTKSDYNINKKVKILSLDNNQNNIKFKNIKRLYYLNKYVKMFEPNIIVTFMPRQSFRVLAIKKLLKKKVVVSVRNDPNKEYKRLKNKIAMKMLYPKADGFIFQTEDAKNYFCEEIQKKSTIIANPIDDSFIVKPYDGIREKVIVNVGRLEKQKNQKLLIDAFYDFQKVHKDYILKIYGDGSLENELRAQINKLNLSQKVFLMGKTDDIKSQIYKASIFILTSDYEGMPNSLMEAMALGIPCISTDCPIGGPKFLIKNNINGILIETNKNEELLDGILKYIEDPKFAKKCGNNASKDMKQFTVKKINNLWLDYIKKIIS